MRREDEEQIVKELKDIRKRLEHIDGTMNFHFPRILRKLEGMGAPHYANDVNYFAIVIVSVLASVVTAFIMLRL